MAWVSPLEECYHTLGLVREPNEWNLPDHFGSSQGEYQTSTEGAVLFDRSHQGKIELTGPEAPLFLHNLSTNDIKNLPLGGGCEAYFCTPQAKVVSMALIYHRLLDSNPKEHALWLDITPAYHQKLMTHLDKHLIAEQVEILDRRDEYAQMHLTGPKAKQILEQALGETLPALELFQHMERTFGMNAHCQIRRNDPLGLMGFDLVCRKEHGVGIWKLLSANGACPAGGAVYEILRIEAVTPIMGIDIDETRFVMEVVRALRAVSYNKGCYLGQEPIVMSRDRAGFVNRTFLPMRVRSETPLPRLTKLFRANTEVGLITSSIFSPYLNGPLALGYLRRGHQEVGTELISDENSGNKVVEVLPLDFKT